MKNRIAMGAMLLMLLFFVLPTGKVAADAVSPFLAEYPVPGKPHAVSVEASNRVWFTLPEENLIGRLIVTSTVQFTVTTFTVPTAASQPYDLEYAGGYVWFTQRDGNKIGRLNPGTGEITEYAIPTADSEPTGIAVSANGTTNVWFTERTANQLGRLVVTGTTTSQMYEYPLPAAFPNAYPQDVAIYGPDSIWFTAPGVNRIGEFKPSFVGGIFDPYEMLLLPDSGVPWSISTGGGSLAVWFTDYGANRIGAYFPQTISNFFWYPLSQSDSKPYGVALHQGRVWFTEETGQRVGEVNAQSGGVYEYGVGATLRGLDVDTGGHVWFAEYGANKIGEWRPPYFYRVALPLVLRS